MEYRKYPIFSLFFLGQGCYPMGRCLHQALTLVFRLAGGVTLVNPMPGYPVLTLVSFHSFAILPVLHPATATPPAEIGQTNERGRDWQLQHL